VREKNKRAAEKIHSSLMMAEEKGTTGRLTFEIDMSQGVACKVVRTVRKDITKT
jgi:hypothetical protein